VGGGPVSALLPATPIDGTDPRALESFFRRLGIPAQSGEMDWRDLAYHTARGRPVAALVQLDGCGHWVAVWRATSRRVSWHCPGRRAAVGEPGRLPPGVVGLGQGRG
jgi:hypothetical protein